MPKYPPAHTHPCQSCGAWTICPGDLVQNPDGFPEIICPAFHLDGGGINPEFCCEDCEPGPKGPR